MSKKVSRQKKTASEPVLDAAGGDPTAKLFDALLQRTGVESDSIAFTDAAQKIFDEQGEAAASALLRTEIQKTKKLEQDIAAAKKRIDGGTKEAEHAVMDLSKAEMRLRQLEAYCRDLKARNDVVKNELENRKSDTNTKLDDMKVSVDKNVSDIETKLAEGEDEISATVAKNVELRAKFDAEKSAFDERIGGIEKEWDELTRASQVKKVEVQRAQLLHTTAKLRYLEKCKKLEEAEVNTKHLQDQLVIFEEKCGQLSAAAAYDPETVQKAASEQEVRALERIKALEAGKKDAVDKKIETDNHAKALRQEAQQLKKTIAAAEKTKVALEKKCRDEQAKAQKAKETQA